MPVSALALPLLTLALQAPATQPAADPPQTAAERMAMLREENRPLVEDDRPDTQLDERKVRELLRTSIEHDFLQVDVLIDDMQRLAEVPLSDWPGVCSLFVREPGVQATLIHQTVDAPDRVLQITQIALLPARLTIARDYETLETQGNVFFIQSQNANFPSDGPVTLRISVTPIDVNDPTVASDERYLVANNFSDLRKRFPEAFETYLLPILDDIAPGFGPYPSGTATQVLLGDIDVDPAVRAQILALLPGLDAESFRERRKTRTALLGLGADVAVIGITLEGLSPEQSAAIEDLVRSYKVVPEAEAVALRDDLSFLVYALADTNAGVRRAAAGRLGELRPDAALPNIDRPVSYELRSELRKTLGLSE